jgi:hypothetical protein
MSPITYLRRVASRCIAAVCLLASLGAVSATAGAAEVTFVIRNDHPYILELQLYSQNRNHVWPNGSEVYVLNDRETKTIPLSCQQGESICYGAWIENDPNGTYWGTGPNNANQCTDCCYVCSGGETEEIQLVE